MGRVKKSNRESRRDSRKLPPDRPGQVPPEATGLEAACLRTWIHSHRTVTVVLTSGERLSGLIRYHDSNLFSLKQATGGPNLLLRKAAVRYIREESSTP